MDTSAADLARLAGPVSRLAGLDLLLLFGFVAALRDRVPGARPQ